MKTKNIHVSVISDITKVRVRIKRKKRLSELYPQRAIIEEARRDSTLVHANDWIDHNYYEEQVEKMPEINDRLIKKYGPVVREKREKQETPVYRVPEMPTVVRRLDIRD